MKFILAIIISIAFSYSSFAQHHSKYKIRIEERNGKISRGNFYAAADDGLTIIKNRRDTVKLSADSIVALHIQRKGIVAPLAIIGGVTFFVLAAKSDKVGEAVALLVAGVPAGFTAGTLIGNLISNRKKYKGLQAKDFPLIKESLQQYTTIK